MSYVQKYVATDVTLLPNKAPKNPFCKRSSISGDCLFICLFIYINLNRYRSMPRYWKYKLILLQKVNVFGNRVPHGHMRTYCRTPQ